MCVNDYLFVCFSSALALSAVEFCSCFRVNVSSFLCAPSYVFFFLSNVEIRFHLKSILKFVCPTVRSSISCVCVLRGSETEE